MDDIEIHERFIVRHKILENLANRLNYDDLHRFTLPMSWANIEDIATQINFPLQKVLDYHHALAREKHIRCEEYTQKHMVGIENEGINAYIDEYWLEQGKKQSLEIRQMQSVVDTNKSVKKTNRFQKWVIGAATLFSAMSLLISYWTYKKDSIIYVMPPKVEILQHTELKGKDTSSQSTLQNQPHNPKHT